MEFGREGTSEFPSSRRPFELSFPDGGVMGGRVGHKLFGRGGGGKILT